ncbi:MAG TPA: TIR domain-containing protein [Candidatus Scalindua sp.]|nr:TIR domain-containing protein [Candidatus Scalindua sp.]
MKVFLSWSGDRSKQIAEVFCDWLKQVIQVVEPFISTDIEKGKRGLDEIKQQLEGSKIGIIFLTKDNYNKPWLLFEAGALSKDSPVCTFLYDLKDTDITGPLTQFQSTKNEKDEIKKLISTINQSVNKKKRRLDEKTLSGVFENYWPHLEEGLKNIPESKTEEGATRRDNNDLLEEILRLVRRQELRQQKLKQPNKISHIGSTGTTELILPDGQRFSFDGQPSPVKYVSDVISGSLQLPGNEKSL